MPTDSFESPLTLAACGGHVDLAMLLIERGANIEEVNDEGYTPLMEAAREGHEEMVHLLLGQGKRVKRVSNFHFPICIYGFFRSQHQRPNGRNSGNRSNIGVLRWFHRGNITFNNNNIFFYISIESL